MAEEHKAYPYSSVLLYNLACDIVEMYKAKITEDTTERFGFTTEMYGKKANYLFHISKQQDGCLLSIEIPGVDNDTDGQISFMFAIVDNMLAQLRDRE